MLAWREDFFPGWALSEQTLKRREWSLPTPPLVAFLQLQALTLAATKRGILTQLRSRVLMTGAKVETLWKCPRAD